MHGVSPEPPDVPERGGGERFDGSEPGGGLSQRGRGRPAPARDLVAYRNDLQSHRRELPRETAEGGQEENGGEG